MIRVGTAGWSLPPEWQEHFPEGGDPEVGLGEWADRLREAHERADDVWCVFDDTAGGEGTGDALALADHLR